MKQLINFKKTKNVLDNKFLEVTLLLEREVFADLPICIIDFDKEYKQPILIGEKNGIYIVAEYEEVKKIQDSQRVFKLVRDPETDRVREAAENEEPTHAVSLPKDTKVEELLIREDGTIEKFVAIEEEKGE